MASNPTNDIEPKPDDQPSSLHSRMMRYLQAWGKGVQTLHEYMKRDFEFVNGIQASNQAKLNVSSTGREMLFFNEIRPQFELLSGYRGSQELDYVAAPRGREDSRLSTIASTLLKATYDVSNKSQHTRRAADDGDIAGIGGLHFGHTFDDATDVVWGDLFIERINPFSIVFDPWGTPPTFQDGKYMGHCWWMHEEDFRAEYPDATMPPSETWGQAITHMIGSPYSASPTTSNNIFVNEKTKHVAVFRLYYRDPVTVYLVADKETGDVYEGGTSRAEANKLKRQKLKEYAEQTVGELQIVPQNDGESIIFVVMNQEGAPVVDPTTQQPMLFPSEEAAQQYIDDTIKEVQLTAGKSWQIWERKRHRIRWCELTVFGEIKKGSLPVTAMHYPHSIYISGQLGDEIDSIEGIVRQIIDRQKEITKRFNALHDHLATSSNSGWLNRKGDGADTRQLEKVGSKQGVVIEYTNVKPEKIEPSQMPAGHFTLLDAAIGGIQRTTGINSELLGLTSTSTVSGEAITARQRGGTTMLFRRLQNYQDFERFNAMQVLYWIQTTMPIEKMRRILGVWEAKNQSSILGRSVFLDPETGEPTDENAILRLLSLVKSTQFDLTLKPMPVDESVRDRHFMNALNMTRVVAETGHMIGPATLKELGNLSELPDTFLASLEADAQAAAQQAIAEQQAAGIGDMIKSTQARLGPQGGG